MQTAEAATSLMTPQAGALSLMALMTDWAQMTDREQWPRPTVKHCLRYLLSSCVVLLVNGAFQLNFIDCDRKHNKKVNTAIFRNILSPGKKLILSLLAYNTHPILCFIFGVKKVRIIRETLRYMQQFTCSKIVFIYLI